ncbi:hypothetical protein [Mesorhizobium koreense]|uniref:hypothetical protein n=1 Tax=Mesorhizobium koreense TaxID=3074855 RepID=UPI00287B904D|nr:hypothetical protein [Mesorhizobium sp. WR6]
MNLLPFIKTREDHDFCTWLWRAIRRGAFPLAFAQLWADSGVEQRELIKIGAGIEELLLGRGDNYSKADRLGRFAVRVDRLIGARAYDEKTPQRQLVGMLFQWANDRRRFPLNDARGDYPLVVGYIAGAAELAIATSMALGAPYETTLAELEKDPGWLADMAFQAIDGHRLPVSRTDVKDTIRFGMTAHGGLGDWLLSEKIESAQEGSAAKLARFLGAADLRGMCASEVSSRIRDRTSEQRAA